MCTGRGKEHVPGGTYDKTDRSEVPARVMTSARRVYSRLEVSTSAFGGCPTCKLSIMRKIDMYKRA